MSNLYISADLKGNCLLQPDFAVVDIPLKLFEIKSLFLLKKNKNKKQRHNFTNKCPYSQSYCFPVVTYGCESWTIKKAECRRTDAFELWYSEKSLESPLDCEEIKPVNPKGNQS